MHYRERNRNSIRLLSMRSINDDDTLPTKSPYKRDEIIIETLSLVLDDDDDDEPTQEQDDVELINVLENNLTEIIVVDDITDEDKELIVVISTPNTTISKSPLTIVGQRNKNKSSSPPKFRPKNLRMQMFSYLTQPIIEIQVISLVFLSCFLQAINTLDDLPNYIHESIERVDTICVYVFVAEFILRWWSAGRFQLRYLAKPLASIDAVSFLILESGHNVCIYYL